MHFAAVSLEGFLVDVDRPGGAAGIWALSAQTLELGHVFRHQHGAGEVLWGLCFVCGGFGHFAVIRNLGILNVGGLAARQRGGALGPSSVYLVQMGLRMVWLKRGIWVLK